MPKAIPTLSSLGWVSSIEQKADFILSYFITSEHSQSYTHWGSVSSLPFLVQRYGDSEVELENKCKEVLTGVMDRTFDQVVSTNVSVTTADDRSGQLSIHFHCVVNEEGREHSLGRKVKFLNSRLVSIAELNNG